MTLEEIYAKIPKLECRQQCGQAFCGPVCMTVPERERMLNLMGWERLPLTESGLSCPCLDPITKTCNAYEARPLICRLWGTVKRLSCPYGCQPSRWLTDKEADALITEYKRLKMVYGFANREFFKAFGYGRGLKKSDFVD